MVKKNNKDVLIRVATKLFSENGYANTSIRDIGKAANVHPSLIYHHFKNKEEIVFTITEDISKYFLRSLEEIQSSGTDPVETLKQMILRHIEIMNKHRNATKIVLDDYVLRKVAPQKEVTSIISKIQSLYLEQLEKLEQLNMLRQSNLPLNMFSILGALNWYLNSGKQIISMNIDAETAINHVVDSLFSGILTK
ncbi:MAG: TetR/AcrR family transcriptional regulator [Desulfatitalea sp.]|nr:TetR/AcrR family transcriptional regulator [Desulfatitalea sp.]NNK02770.1 TetR/AcrR family transcriptional regulator [Desulfatitalea sp.]